MFTKLTVTAIIILTLFTGHNTSAQLKPALADSFLNFIKANKDRSSLYITRNDTIAAFLNESQLMPLAGTMNILVAIEFAKQVGDGLLLKNSMVSLDELDKYYLSGSDGGAHTKWLDYEKKQHHISSDSARLIDVARGMMMFGSNANTEYLMDLLGINNIKSNIKLFGLKSHTDIYPPAASLMIYQNPKELKEEKIIKGITTLNRDNYIKYVNALHGQLKFDKAFKATFRPRDLTMNMLALWNSRLPASTTKDYVHLANILNSRSYLNDSAFKAISETMEYPMETELYKKDYKQIAFKTSGTGLVLTHVAYLITRYKSKFEMAFFFYNLEPAEEKKLMSWLDPFEASIIYDAAFRKKLNFQ